MASFKSAFASARKAGKKTFLWNGKSYTTELAKGATGPKRRPSAVDAKGPMPRATPSTTALRPKPRPGKAVNPFATPPVSGEPVGKPAERAKNAEARAAAKAARNKDRKAKTQTAAAALRKKLGFDK